MKAMIFAAGLGTRLKPITETIPKALVEVNGITLLERNINYLAGFGFNEIIVNIHHHPKKVIDFISSFNNKAIKIHVSDETDCLLDTGGGLKKAAPFFKNETAPIALLNVDILSNLNLLNMLDFHNKHKPLATLAVAKRETSRYFLFDDNFLLKGWENTNTKEIKPLLLETKNLTPLAFSGIHIVSPQIFNLLDNEVKFSITNTYIRLCKSFKIMGFDHSGDKFIDVGKPGTIEAAALLF